MGWFGRKRFVLSTLMVGLDVRRAPDVARALADIQADMVRDGQDHAQTQAHMGRAVQVLLENQAAWQSSALLGEEFTREEDAGEAGLHTFSELCARYEGLPALERPDTLVVAITTGYAGTVKELEQHIHTAPGVRDALLAVRMLAQTQRASLLHLHVVPLPGDGDAVMAAFPELLDF
jgi:hypothetical protein